MPVDQSSRVVAVTGASSGIGRETARLLARRGDRVILAARRADGLDAAVAQIRSAGGEAVACPADVTRPADLDRLVATATGLFGRLDALIANAGVAVTGPVAAGKLPDWNQMIDVNLRGVLHGVAAALPVFTAQGSGHFVTVTSTAAEKWVPGMAVYAASKAGVRAFCEVLRQEAGPAIRVTMIRPGGTDTEFTSDPEILRRFAGMWMSPAAVAAAIAYALDQPADVNVGEIVLRSAAQP